MTRRACKIIDLTNFKIYPSMTSLAEELNVTSGAIYNLLVRNNNPKKDNFFRKRYEYFDLWLTFTEKEKMKYVKGENIYFYQPWERMD